MKTKILLQTLYFVSILVCVNIQQACTQNTKVKVEKGKTSYKYTDINGRKNVTYQGDIELSDDEKSIVSISPNGYLEYESNKKSLLIKSNAQGQLSYTYKVRGREQAFEPEGKAFLASILSELINQGFAAESRVAKLYAKGGANQVLGAIEQLNSDFVKGKYFKYLFKQQGLSNQDLAQAFDKLATTIRSDFETSKVLRDAPKGSLKQDQVSQAYLNAVNSISSDFEQGKVLTHLIKYNNSETTLRGAIEATQDISSDFEQGKVLRTALDQPNINPGHITQILKATQKIASDFETAKVLRHLLGKTQMNQEVFVSFLNASDGISSDFEKSKVFMSALSKEKLNQESLKELLERIPKISSDFEKRKVMVALAGQIPSDNDQLREAYFKTAKTISSDHEYGKVMRAFQE